MQANSSRAASARKASNALFWAVGPLLFFSSVMSILSLIEYAIADWRWTAIARLLVESWNEFLEKVFTTYIPLRLVLEQALSQIAHFLNLKAVPTLYPHWKHVFVLLMAVFGSYTKEVFSEGRKIFGVYGLSVGLFFSLLAALVSGIVPLDPEDFLANLVVASAPGVLFFLAVYVIWLPIKNEPYESHGFPDFLIRTGVTFATIATATLILMRIDSVRSNVNVGLLCLTGFALVIAFHRIYCGWDSARRSRGPFLSQPLTRRGLYILSAFLGAAILVLLDAGARL